MDEILSRAFCLDFETTDVEPAKAKVCEVAIYNDLFEFQALVNPDCPIPAETSAVHHITDEDVVDAQYWGAIKTQLMEMFGGRTPLPIFVAHNAKYEQVVLGEFVPVIWVCTYKCALRIWPDAPSHKNEVLRYHLGLGDGRGRNSTQRPHSALHDAVVTFQLFKELLKHASIDQLVEWSEEPALFPRVPFGKWRGEPWTKPDSGYFIWMLKQADMDADLKWNAQRELNRRSGRT